MKTIKLKNLSAPKRHKVHVKQSNIINEKYFTGVKSNNQYQPKLNHKTNMGHKPVFSKKTKDSNKITTSIIIKFFCGYMDINTLTEK